MSCHPVRSLALLLVVLPLLTGGAGGVAAQGAAPAHVVGNTYTSLTYGYSLTWDDSWYVLTDTAPQGEDALKLSNGSGTVGIYGVYGNGYGGEWHGQAPSCVRDLGRSIGTNPQTSHVKLLRDAAGRPVRGGDTTRSFAAYTYREVYTDGSVGDVVDSIECRTLPGWAMLEIIGITPQTAYADQVPLLQALLTGLIVPSLGERAPVFVAGPWRVAVVAAIRGDHLPAADLHAKAGKDWLLVVADVTDWSAAAATLPVTGFGLRLAGVANPVGVAPRSTAATAAQLGTAPTDIAGGVPSAAGQTQRLTLVFLIPHTAAGPTLALAGSALPLTDVLARKTDIGSVPPIVGPPPLRQATVVTVYDGATLDVRYREETATDTVRLIGLDPAGGNACVAARATAALKALAGTAVWLEQAANDTAMPSLARYVWVVQADGTKTLLNQRLLASGEGVPAPLLPEARFGAWLGEGARAAQAAKAGVWGACPGAPGQTGPAGTPVATPGA